MRISGFYIDGFGIFHNQSVQDIPAGLILFTGKNEGGKTTLMEFIRSILFGFPKGKKNDYQFSLSGNHGGRLKVVMQDGRVFTAERIGKHPSITEDGKAVEQIEPSERLSIRIDRQTFERIFAVGLEDMKGLDVLSREGIRGRLLAASTGAASVPFVIKQIDDEMENLLKSRGKNPIINNLVRQLDEIDSEIKKLHGRSSEYAELQRSLADLNEQIRQKKQESEAIRQRLVRIEGLGKARDPWIEICEARIKVKELESARSFPPSGLTRLEKLKEEIEGELKEKKTLETKISNLDAQLSRLMEGQKARKSIIEGQKTIRTLVKEREKLISALNDLPAIKSETKHKESDFKRKLGDLGSDWTSERLAETDTSVQIRNRVQKFGRDLGAAERNFEQLQADKRAAETAEKRAKKTADEAQESFNKLTTPLIENTEILRKKREAVREMRSFFHQKETTGIQRYDKSQRLDAEKSRLITVEKRMEERIKSLPSWLPLTALAVGLVLAAVSVIWNPYILTPLIAIASVGIMFWLRASRKDQLAQETARIAQIQEEKQQITKIITDLNNEIEKFGNSILYINSDIKRIAQEADIKQPEDLRELDAVEAELEEAGERLRDWIEQKKKNNEAIENWHNTQNQLKEAEQAVNKAQDKLQKLENDWQNWIAEQGFSRAVRPDEFGTILQMVENARTSERSLQESLGSVKKMETYISEIRVRIREALKICNVETSEDNVGVAELDALEQILNDSLKTKQKQESLEQQLMENKETKEQIDDRLTRKNTERDNLLNQAGASDEEEFRRNAKNYDDWSNYKHQIENRNSALRAIAGNVDAQTKLEEELANTESYKLKSEEDSLREQLDVIKDQISEQEQSAGGIKKSLEQMPLDESLSKLLLEQSRLKEEFSDAVKHWATLAITRHLLDQARGVYERERQPKVIQDATRFVEVMTHKPYRMVMPAGDSKIQLEDKITLNRKSEIGWSSGLADQVYLAIRFGLAQDFAQHEEPLPIILDDVLVRFDPERQLGAARVILDLSQHHQILMFTCDPDIREITEKALESCILENNVNITYYTINNGIIMKE